MVREILRLGNPLLYKSSDIITQTDRPNIKQWVDDLHDTLMEYRNQYGAGRAIAAPQIGVQKRLIYMFIDKPTVFINPTLSFPDQEKYELLDDCMSFPGLVVLVERYKKANIEYFDLEFHPHYQRLDGDLSELLQHEYDHLDGILATMRAVDNRSFFMK